MRIQWTIVVAAEAGDEEGAAMQLRGLLKVAGRRFGMRCVAVGEERVVRSAGRRERGDAGGARGSGEGAGGGGERGAMNRS